MRIKAISPWLGSKRNLAEAIVKQLGPHKAFCEPFCGSMAVLLAKPSCVFEIANDLHGDLINLALTIQHERWGPRLYRRLRRVVYNEIEFKTAAECISNCSLSAYPDHVTEVTAQRAYYYFVLSWMGRSETLGTASKPSFTVRYTPDGGNQAQRFHGAVTSIPAWRRRLRSVTITCQDGLKLLAKIPDRKGIAIYVDPPYLVKNAAYLHDFTHTDHQKLAQLLHKFTVARVVVSYYDSPQLCLFYPN